ncbi:MAG: hypothetical protein NC254_14670, partial [bacterium]|nr:hypothetical protein [bacterium]
TGLTFPYFQGFAVCQTSNDVSFSLILSLWQVTRENFSYSVLIRSNNLTLYKNLHLDKTSSI